MSYMRGACYIWGDDERVHVWAEDGYDSWDESSWAEGVSDGSGSAQNERASGVCVPHVAMDAFVVMRLAELVAEQRGGTVVEAAVAQLGGNGGCLAPTEIGCRPRERTRTGWFPSWRRRDA